MTVSRSQIDACPRRSLSPAHYREDGTCHCVARRCTVPWCDRDGYALELCTKHYRRHTRHGEATTPDERAAYEQGIADGKAQFAAMM